MAFTVVTGPPASGKSTFIAERAVHGDVVIDFDLLAVALGSGDSHVHPPGVAQAAGAARAAALDAALGAGVNVWLVHAMPSPTALAIYRRQGADVVVIDPGEAVVRSRVAAERGPVSMGYVDSWYRS